MSPEIEDAKRAASHYGFVALPKIEIEKVDISSAKKFDVAHKTIIRPFQDESERFSGYLEEKIAIIRHITDKSWSHLGMPVMGYYEGPIKGNTHIVRSTEEKTFNIEAIGGGKAITDAIVIETAYVILKERYPDEEFCVNINSIGDKESMAKFARELSNYCKKELPKMPAHMRSQVKRDPFNLFCECDEKCLEIKESAPKPMAFLSEQSRNHFSEVLEFLESLSIPYEINHELLGSRSYCTETIFEIKGRKKIYALGERYNGLAKKVFGKKDMPAIGAAILIHPHFVMSKEKTVKKTAPKFYFIQISAEAKHKSLIIIEKMRQAKIPVHQSLSKDKLSVQLATAEKMEIPYILMMGQREAIENMVVVRNMMNHSQETVAIENLIIHLKKVK